MKANARHKSPQNPNIQSMFTPLRRHSPINTGPIPCPNEIKKKVMANPIAGAQSKILSDHIPKNAVVTMKPRPKTAADAYIAKLLVAIIGSAPIDIAVTTINAQ